MDTGGLSKGDASKALTESSTHSKHICRVLITCWMRFCKTRPENQYDYSLSKKIKTPDKLQVLHLVAGENHESGWISSVRRFNRRNISIPPWWWHKPSNLVLDLGYFKLWILLDKIIKGWNIKGLYQQVAKIIGVIILCLWQTLNSFCVKSMRLHYVKSEWNISMFGLKFFFMKAFEFFYS